MVSKKNWSVLLHLRLPFSLLLLPVFLFALSQLPDANTSHVLLVFFILHFLTYPASNAYNSYFDKDEGSIAMLETPPKVNLQLYYTAVALEWIGFILAFFVGAGFALAVFVYNSFSKAYSHPKIRLKKYPILSFLVVFIFQGCFIYYSCYAAMAISPVDFWNSKLAMAGLICSCLVGASYPLTQIYQHQEDAKRGDVTLSILLGVKGSFVFSGIVFFLGFALMFIYWLLAQKMLNFYVFVIFTAPAIVYFIWWFLACLQNATNANFKNTMRMTLLSGSLTLTYFLWLWLFA